METVVDAGGRVILDCQAAGEPQPTITWSRQGQPISWDNRLSMLPNSSLYIAAARKEDTSEYECVARNLMGSVLVRVPVIVQGKWENESKKAQLPSLLLVYQLMRLKQYSLEDSNTMLIVQNPNINFP